MLSIRGALDRRNQLLWLTLVLPRVPVVVHVPRCIKDWQQHDEQEMAMRRCGYWRSLRGMEKVPNTSKVTVRISRSNRFDVAGLRAIMERVARRQPL